ncbi:DUF4391 domain-containing protein [bacterium]|nr:DUF4391 domain-containing protein [bacterium]MBU1995071.1 DUF4391 domain-containing protein [bacterium]
MSFALPKSTLADKFLPKKVFEAKTPKGKKVFKTVVKITLTHKLSPHTINIEKTVKVPEILLFEIVLHEKKIPKNAIKAIDAIISLPILYKFVHEEHFCFGISLLEEKRYFYSEWDEVKEFSFSDTTLEKVYQNIVKSFLHVSTTKDFKESLALEQKVQTLGKEIQALENKIKNEKQFKKQLELSRILKPLEQEFQNLLKENDAKD